MINRIKIEYFDPVLLNHYKTKDTKCNHGCLTPLKLSMRSACYKLKFIITLLQISWRTDKDVLKRRFKLWTCKQIYIITKSMRAL